MRSHDHEREQKKKQKRAEDSRRQQKLSLRESRKHCMQISVGRMQISQAARVAQPYSYYDLSWTSLSSTLQCDAGRRAWLFTSAVHLRPSLELVLEASTLNLYPSRRVVRFISVLPSSAKSRMSAPGASRTGISNYYPLLTTPGASRTNYLLLTTYY